MARQYGWEIARGFLAAFLFLVSVLLVQLARLLACPALGLTWMASKVQTLAQRVYPHPHLSPSSKPASTDPQDIMRNSDGT